MGGSTLPSRRHRLSLSSRHPLLYLLSCRCHSLPVISSASLSSSVIQMAENSTAAVINRVGWTNKAGLRVDYRSELLLKWLEQHPKERGHLFSVNNRALREQGEQVTTSKHPKAYYHGLIARHIFSQDQDPGVRQLYADSSNDKAWGAKVRTRIAAYDFTWSTSPCTCTDTPILPGFVRSTPQSRRT